MREAVAGYRQPRLERELEGARQVLEAAGIDWQIEQMGEPLPAAIETVLAWVVREGVTNVVRHSRARRCGIEVTQTAGQVRLEVTNDDRNSSQQGPRFLTAPARGSGLVSLAERVAAQGGHFEAGPWLSDGVVGFRLQVELPLRSPVKHGDGAAPVQAHQSVEEEVKL